ncbi:hypothetical protein [Haloferax larsenii]|uniref:Uncharacterized protein n=1 Tax=Haloferax larsenii TaxID=302484 RepID=A0A1H7N5K9_HALLR|nr:hypothetical protein [Haloferax larsenii]SEL18157.1 hypothetical protein SAMN04488691_103183 [Haloferax larsenii]
MAAYSYAGPGQGVEKPEEVITDQYEEFGRERLFVGWQGNGYQEDSCWLVADLDIVCDLSTWE